MHFGGVFRLIRPKRAPGPGRGFSEGWLQCPMGFWKTVPDERRSVGDRQHRWRGVDRDIPCQVAPLQSLTQFLPARSVERLRFVALNKHWTLEPWSAGINRFGIENESFLRRRFSQSLRPPAESLYLCMRGKFQTREPGDPIGSSGRFRRSRGRTANRKGKAVMNADGKSDDLVVPTKRANKAATAVAEPVEERRSPKGSDGGLRASRTPSRYWCTSASRHPRQVTIRGIVIVRPNGGAA